MNRETIKKIGIVLAILLIAVGIFLPIPSKKIDSWASADDGGYKEYVGGDAYNIIIEASLRGGIIAGRTAAKAILISVGVLQLFFALALNTDNNFNSEYTVNPTSSTLKYNVKSEPPEIKNIGDTWTCPNCGESNLITQRICKGCGHNK